MKDMENVMTENKWTQSKRKELAKKVIDTWSEERLRRYAQRQLEEILEEEGDEFCRLFSIAMFGEDE